jgi:hypothetical protein
MGSALALRRIQEGLQTAVTPGIGTSGLHMVKTNFSE